MTPDMPPEQLERLRPIVETLLADLRRRTANLAPHVTMALNYDPARIHPDEVAAS